MSALVVWHMIVVWLSVGAIAGWLIGLAVKGFGLGLTRNVVTGMIGAVIAGGLLFLIGFAIGGPLIAHAINAAIGAVVALAIVGIAKR